MSFSVSNFAIIINNVYTTFLGVGDTPFLRCSLFCALFETLLSYVTSTLAAPLHSLVPPLHSAQSPDHRVLSSSCARIAAPR